MKISMKIGPQKTETGGFKGFGMKMGGSATSSSSAPGRPLAAGSSRSSAAAKAKAASGGMASVFRETLDDELDQEASNKKMALPIWAKPTAEAKQSARIAETLLAEDATVFQYDEIIDDVKTEAGIELPSQNVKTAALEQKKKIGLVLREGVEACRTGYKREAKYIEKVMIATDRRKVEQQMVEDRLLKKEQDAREGREVFVTQAFKEELKRRSKFEEELEEQELRDSRRDAAKQEDGQGFADFHRKLLNGGLASSRGGEKIVDRAAPRMDLPTDEPVKKEELPEEDDKEAKDVKTEDGEEKVAEHGVEDVQAAAADPGTKAAKLLAEQEERAEKAMSAKERFLARKRKAAEALA